ncbi:U protein [Human adenovirus 18]|uniref:U protein n=1 Tax=Human adenovirus A serotype 18 TaxID=10528 RepID=D3JIU3_ADE18|nr:U protein [Human adenovirus 18]
MKMVGRGWEEESDIPFKVWRKFAICKSVKYDSWEEGKLIRVHGDHDIFSDFR